MLKKMILTMMSTVALVAFTSPSMASASTWDRNGVPSGEDIEQGDIVSMTGTLSVTKAGLKISCRASGSFILWNDPENGAVGSPSILRSQDPLGTGACTVALFVPGVNQYVDVSGCHVTPLATSGFWITTSEDTVAIEGVDFFEEFNGCGAALKIPDGTQISSEGTLTGTAEENCIVFNQSGDLSGEALIDGSLCPLFGELELTP